MTTVTMPMLETYPLAIILDRRQPQLVKTRLKQMRNRHGLIDGFLTATGLKPP